MFNHKGGVSKTTTTFHLGWMLAENVKKFHKTFSELADEVIVLTQDESNS